MAETLARATSRGRECPLSTRRPWALFPFAREVQPGEAELELLQGIDLDSWRTLSRRCKERAGRDCVDREQAGRTTCRYRVTANNLENWLA